MEYKLWIVKYEISNSRFKIELLSIFDIQDSVQTEILSFCLWTYPSQFSDIKLRIDKLEVNCEYRINLMIDIVHLKRVQKLDPEIEEQFVRPLYHLYYDIAFIMLYSCCCIQLCSLIWLSPPLKIKIKLKTLTCMQYIGTYKIVQANYHFIPLTFIGHGWQSLCMQYLHWDNLDL